MSYKKFILKNHLKILFVFILIYIFMRFIFDRAESMPRPIMCKLCSTDIENVAMMRIHLITRLHLEREKQVGYLH